MRLFAWFSRNLEHREVVDESLFQNGFHAGWVRRETPNPNIVRLRVGVRFAHPNLPGYFDISSSINNELEWKYEVPRLLAAYDLVFASGQHPHKGQ